MPSPSVRIGVLVTCFEEGELLARSLNSLRVQTDKDFDTVIVNDGGKDARTREICVGAASERTAVVVRDANGGTSAARNTGCAALDTDVVIPLDADDELPADTVRLVRQAFLKTPAADFIFGDHLKKNIEHRTQARVDCGYARGADGFLDSRKLAKRFIIHGASPFRKALWERADGYDESVCSGAEDLDFWLRALVGGARGFYVPEILYQWNRSRSGHNARVLPGAWDYVYEKNKFFFMSADETVWPRLVFLRHLFLENFREAKKAAWPLIRKKVFSLPVILFAFFPAGAAGALYRLKKNLLGAARPY